MSGNRMHFKVIEKRVVEYDFKITPEIMNDFENWKCNVLETTDVLPTELEILNYFKELPTPSIGPSGFPTQIEVCEMYMIDEDDDFNLRP